MSTAAAPRSPSHAAGGLCDRLRELCEQTRRLLPPGPAADAVDAVRDRLGEPTLRIAVGGRIKAGKSTLVNALLGQRLAATAVTECTLIVAWFRYSHQNRIEVHCRDGRVYRVPGPPGGGVPADLALLGARRDEIAEIVVEVANERLAHDYTVVDTPGTDSLSGLDDAAAAALARADALLYVTPHPGEGDVEALQRLRQSAAAHGINAINVLGVLSRVDLQGDGISDPWPTARRLADRYSARLAGVVARVIPVSGLLAQTVLGDEFTEADMVLLRRVAGEPEDALREAMFSHETFLQWGGGGLTVADRQRLLDLLGRYGVVTAVGAIRSHVASGSPLTTAGLLGCLRADSGVDELLAEIRARFLGSADRLRAAAAITVLDAVIEGAHSPRESAVMTAMRRQLAEIRQHPLLRQAELSAALADLSAGNLPLPDDDLTTLRRLAGGTTPAACLGLPESADLAVVAAAADAEVRRWQQHEWSYAQAVRRYAGLARELCEAYYFEAEADARPEGLPEGLSVG